MKNGIKTSTLNLAFIITEFLLSIIVCYTFIIGVKNYDNFYSVVTDFADTNKTIINYNMYVDNLERQCKQYVVTKDTIELESYSKDLQYFLEVREEYLTFFQDDLKLDADTFASFKASFKESDKLIKDDLYSAKLVWVATHKDTATMSGNIKEVLENVELSSEDKMLSDSSKITKAMGILFGSTYSKNKQSLKDFVEKTYKGILKEAGFVQQQKEENSKIYIYIFSISLILLLLVMLAYICCIMIFVINPINNQTKMIEKGQKMDEEGAYESRYIAKAYNSLLDKNEIKASILKHKAEHDFLTGLINTAGFEQIKKAFLDYDDSLAFLLIDIDFFKNINDTYGHTVGNDVLKKIARLLSEQFRNSDYVARIGGDEFAVLMTKIGETPEEVILNKISNLNSILQNVDDSLPSVSLSVGVSLSQKGFKEEMIKQADEALYKVKKGGRCNCSFYKSQNKSNKKINKDN